MYISWLWWRRDICTGNLISLVDKLIWLSCQFSWRWTHQGPRSEKKCRHPWFFCRQFIKYAVPLQSIPNWIQLKYDEIWLYTIVHWSLLPKNNKSTTQAQIDIKHRTQTQRLYALRSGGLSCTSNGFPKTKHGKMKPLQNDDYTTQRKYRKFLVWEVGVVNKVVQLFEAMFWSVYVYLILFPLLSFHFLSFLWSPYITIEINNFIYSPELFGEVYQITTPPEYHLGNLTDTIPHGSIPIKCAKVM